MTSTDKDLMAGFSSSKKPTRGKPVPKKNTSTEPQVSQVPQVPDIPDELDDIEENPEVSMPDYEENNASSSDEIAEISADEVEFDEEEVSPDLLDEIMKVESKNPAPVPQGDPLSVSSEYDEPYPEDENNNVLGYDTYESENDAYEDNDEYDEEGEYDPNWDHYYDDIKPEIDAEIERVNRDTILKGIGLVAGVILVIMYMIFIV